MSLVVGCVLEFWVFQEILVEVVFRVGLRF